MNKLITADIIFSAFIFIFLLILVQFILWRIFKVRRQMIWLLIIFLIVPIAFWCLFYKFQLEWLVLIISFSGFYIQTLPMAQALSPSVLILLKLDAAKQEGLTQKEILDYIRGVSILKERIEDLKRDGLVYDLDGQLYLTPFGEFLGTVFYYYRRLLGLSRGDG